MFWALNGATLTPWRRSQRMMPATMTLLPASEVVPATSSAPLTGTPGWCSDPNADVTTELDGGACDMTIGNTVDVCSNQHRNGVSRAWPASGTMWH